MTDLGTVLWQTPVGRSSWAICMQELPNVTPSCNHQALTCCAGGVGKSTRADEPAPDPLVNQGLGSKGPGERARKRERAGGQTECRESKERAKEHQKEVETGKEDRGQDIVMVPGKMSTYFKWHQFLGTIIMLRAGGGELTSDT